MVVVETRSLRVKASESTGAVTFIDKATGQVIVQEGTHSFMPVKDQGEDTFQVEQNWLESSPTDGLWGGGQYQSGILNFKNAPIQMVQFNTEAIVPFFVSSEGYGLLWDNYAWTFLNPPTNALVPPGGASEASFDFTPEVDGDHFFYVGKPFPAAGENPGFGSKGVLAGQMVSVNITDGSGRTTVVQSWAGYANLPNSLTGRATGLQQGHAYKVSYSSDMPGVGLYVQGPEYGRTSLRSAIGQLVDYYFVAGSTADAVVAGYREITGAAPLYGKYAYGFWQCKEHYDTQDHLLTAAHGFRNRSIPVDAIVQDWHYWGDLGWGPQWDLTLYPDPAAMVRELDALSMKLMVSVWSRFDENTQFYKDMGSKGYLLSNSTYYDAWNPRARELFYNFSDSAHFSIGVESLWLDATEPENLPNINAKTFLGTGNALMNSYSLLSTRAISDGLRKHYPKAQGARVFSLTRSAFAGQQATGAALWSGDTSGKWDVLRRQVAASINYAMSGMPYWSEDIGGFFRPADQYTSADYHDLLTRWFQFGVFTPIFRVHGAGSTTELWNYGDGTMHNINASAVSLRYRLLPYIYSGFARVETEGYTMQRALAMDFPEDNSVRSIADEYMFGDAFLVIALTTPLDPKSGRTLREAYLPTVPGAGWINFHTGSPAKTGPVSFLISEAPVFVRPGSIVPLGPFLQHTGQVADPIEIRVYKGSDASFLLFEDDGHSQEYQDGVASRISFTWAEKTGELSVSAREGQFPGMLASRTFQVVWVSPGHGVGVMPAAAPDATIQYRGESVTVRPPATSGYFV